MRWQPFYGFKTGLDQAAWDRLSTSEQRTLLSNAGKSRKGKRYPAPEEPQDEITIERFSLPIRTVSREELARMPRYRA
jgi:hypothetical protein